MNKIIIVSILIFSSIFTIANASNNENYIHSKQRFENALTLKESGKQKKFNEELVNILKENPDFYGALNEISELNYNSQVAISLMAIIQIITLNNDTSIVCENLKKMNELFNRFISLNEDNKVEYNVPNKLMKKYVTACEKTKLSENEFALSNMCVIGAGTIWKENPENNQAENFLVFYQKFLQTFIYDKHKSSGFYWNYFVPYFIEIENNGYSEILSYLIYRTTGDSKIDNWLNNHKNKVEEFNQWHKNYKWTK